MRTFVVCLAGCLVATFLGAGSVHAGAAGAQSASPTASAAAIAAPGEDDASISHAVAGVSGIPFTFRASPFVLRDLPVTQRAFSGSRVCPRVDTGIHDGDGARMRLIGGRLYDFPRGQATYGLDNLNSYTLTDDEFYLERALVQADRLVSYHDESGEAWYYPNYPSKGRHGISSEYLRAPYYSALSQGRVLLFFSRLALVTGLEKWQRAAYHSFLAYLRLGPTSGLYVVNVDSRGYYWLQEWPFAGMRPDCTLNGHNSSAFGLFEYYMVTGDERARALFRGAVTTVKHYLPSYRRGGWISCYCLAHRATNANYHNMHVGQLLALYKLTGDVAFARWSDRFSDDYPKPEVEGRLRVEPGAYEAIRVSTSGRVVARRSIRVRTATSWPATRRQRLWPSSPIFLKAAAGPAQDWWLRERPGHVYLHGMAAPRGYEPVRTLVVGAGESFIALQFDERAEVKARLAVRATDGLRLTVDKRAVINGSDRVRVKGGELDDYWVPVRRGLRLL